MQNLGEKVAWGRAFIQSHWK